MPDRQAEEATGIPQNPHGLGTCYLHGGIEVDPRDVPKRIREGHAVEVPNAGAGSYKEFFTDMAGYEEVKTIETCSSAGDWTLAVCEKGRWHMAFQSNRYPYHGFSYSVVRRWKTTFEDLCKLCEC